MSQAIQKAARILCRGGVIAYPTEGVFGLGCLPGDSGAVQRLLDIKQRDAGKGLVLIVSDALQAADWIEKELPNRMQAVGVDEEEIRKELKIEADQWVQYNVDQRSQGKKGTPSPGFHLKE